MTAPEGTAKRLAQDILGLVDTMNLRIDREERAERLIHEYVEQLDIRQDLMRLTEARNREELEWLNVQRLLQSRIDQLAAPVPMRLTCPECGELHIDEGEFATKPHHTHACQHCGAVWRPAIVHTVGVRFLPGFKNGETQ